eukprot:2156472-Rhodomonas_salina.2
MSVTIRAICERPYLELSRLLLLKPTLVAASNTANTFSGAEVSSANNIAELGGLGCQTCRFRCGSRAVSPRRRACSPRPPHPPPRPARLHLPPPLFSPPALALSLPQPPLPRSPPSLPTHCPVRPARPLRHPDTTTHLAPTGRLAASRRVAP